MTVIYDCETRLVLEIVREKVDTTYLKTDQKKMTIDEIYKHVTGREPTKLK